MEAGTQLVVPTARELQDLDAHERWNLEDALGEVQHALRAFNDAELRRWVEEGKTQTEIAGMVGRDQSVISRRCIRLGLQPLSNRGRPRNMQVHISPDHPAAEPEPIDAEVVEDADSDPMSVHYSSDRDDWETPQDLFDELDSEFGFELDVCALEASAKCERFFTPAEDGLAQEWTGTCWMNPPYGEIIVEWVHKARRSAEAGATVVCLVPARVDTAWWWENCLAGEIRFLRGRLRFGGGESGAPFPSAVVVFHPGLRGGGVKWWDRG